MPAVIVLLRARRGVAALGVLAVVSLMKVFLAAVAPLELDRLRGYRQRELSATVAFLAVGLVIGLPAVLAPFPVTSFAGDYAGRANWDSFWGLIDGIGGLRIASSGSDLRDHDGRTADHLFLCGRAACSARY